MNLVILPWTVSGVNGKTLSLASYTFTNLTTLCFWFAVYFSSFSQSGKSRYAELDLSRTRGRTDFGMR
jgi:hypothetical protein